MNTPFSFELQQGQGLSTFFAGLIAVYGALLLLGIVNYVLRSLSLYRIAKRRGMSNCAVAWVLDLTPA